MTCQKERILQHLTDFGSITSAEAMQDYGIMRLASRIDELRKAGHTIVTERVEGCNRYGEKCHWARYKIGGSA